MNKLWMQSEKQILEISLLQNRKVTPRLQAIRRCAGKGASFES